MIKRAACWIASWPMAIPVGFWGWLHGRRILKAGRKLNSQELSDAKNVGVSNPERIRVLAIQCLPNPFDKISGIVEKITSYSIFDPAGMTLHYGVFTILDQEHDRSLLAHEFVHVAQYERFGTFGFMRRYIFQCLADGYHNAPMEIEARERSDRALECSA